MLISKNGHGIDSVESWFDHAPPKEGLRQWLDGRSAKELAKAFFRGGTMAVPVELQRLLDSSSVLGELSVVDAWPEHRITLDSFRGETRNADLAALATGTVGPIAITVEAKADESFGEVVRDVLATAPPRSNVPARVNSLASALFPLGSDVSEMRYQLIHGAAASLILAGERHAVAGVFVVLEFRSDRCSAANLERNRADFQRLVSLLGAGALGQELLGPVRVPGGGRISADIPLFVGKAVCAC